MSASRMKRLMMFSLVLTGCWAPSTKVIPVRSEIAIRDQYFQGQVRIDATSKGFRVRLIDHGGHESDRAIFNYPHYQLDTADVNQDGRTEILIGLTKVTRFDPQERKRLFILQIDEGQLRPLWLGSKLCQQLVDFKTMSNGIVRTLEKTPSGTYSIGIYEWQGFGLTLVKYIVDEKTYSEAHTAFNS